MADSLVAAWSRWWERVTAVHELVDSTDRTAPSLDQINAVFDAEAQARRSYARALRREQRRVPDYLSPAAPLVAPSPTPPPPDRL